MRTMRRGGYWAEPRSVTHHRAVDVLVQLDPNDVEVPERERIAPNEDEETFWAKRTELAEAIKALSAFFAAMAGTTPAGNGT